MHLFCRTARAAFASRAAISVYCRKSPLIATVLVSLPLLVGPAAAGSLAPHEMTYRALADTALRVEMDAASQQLGTIQRGARGIRLHWCEPAIPRQAWRDATLGEQRALLDGRWCEVETNGVVGNVDGRALSPG